MRVEVAIFLEVDRAALGALGRIISRIPPKSRRRASLTMARGPSFDGWELPRCPRFHSLRDVP
jgi:hypothetical protein